MAIALTGEQKKREWLNKQYTKIADGLAAFKNREQLNRAQVADGLGINAKTVTKLLNREPLRLDIDTLFLVLNAAGLMIVPIKREEEKGCPVK